MDADRVKKTIARCPSSGQLEITFKENGYAGLLWIFQAHEKPVDFSINRRDLFTVMAVMVSLNWEHDRNRRVLVDYGDVIVLNEPLERAAPMIENITLVGVTHKLNLLMAKPPKPNKKQRKKAKQPIDKRQQFVDSLNREILPAVQGELSEWGLECRNSIVNGDGFPRLVYEVMEGEEVVGEFSLDGWSGSIMTGGYMLEQYTKPARVVELLLTVPEDILA